jgi:uncharacterized protein DUF4349
MRRRETTLDPAVAAELEALEAALAGDSAAEPELAALVRDVRADAPAMAPAFRARLDDRVERGFPKPTRSRPRRNLVPALAVAGCVLATLVAVVLVGGGSGDDSASSTPAVSAQSGREQQAQGDAASGAGGSGAAAPSTAAAPRTRRVERTTRLALATTDVQRTADDVVSATQSVGGFVQSSQVATTNGRGSASFTLRVPSARLDDAVARLSKLGHVRSLEQSAQDITGAYDSAAARLAEARAERRGLLRALAKATTAQEISSLRARIADNRRELQRYQREFESVRNRANFATVEVDVTSSTRKGEPVPGGGGSWSPGDAARDAVRVLEVSAGVALVGLAVLVPVALLGAAGGVAAGAWRRRRRESALQT